MPDEYISREKTLALLKSLGSRDYRREKGTIQDAIKMISSSAYTPAADVAPVVHGEWIGNKGGFWEMATCSICDSMCDEEYPCVGMAPNFCPNCGAKMDGGNEYE